MKTIHLHGSLRDRFGGPFSLQVATAREAARAMAAQIPGFRQAVAEGYFRVTMGPLTLGERELDFRMGDGAAIHIVPVVAGSGRGVGKIVAGVALIALSIVTAGGAAAGAAAGGAAAGGAAAGGAAASGMAAAAFTIAGVSVTYGQIAMLGVSMVLSGVASALSPTPRMPDPSSFERADERPSFIFSGPVNSAEQGGPVPLVFGRMRVGSHVVSSGLHTEAIS